MTRKRSNENLTKIALSYIFKQKMILSKNIYAGSTMIEQKVVDSIKNSLSEQNFLLKYDPIRILYLSNNTFIESTYNFLT